MALEKIFTVEGTGVPVMGDEIDTDRIIPARFMKCVTFDGLGAYAFFDAIKESENAGRVHPFGDERFKGGSILISGANFGCGSSREHAPQALFRSGIRAVVAESFAEIFYGNATTLGMPCVTLPREKLNELAQRINQQPEMKLELSLESKTVKAGDWEASFSITDSALQSLMAGKWDPIVELGESSDTIEKLRNTLPYMAGY